MPSTRSALSALSTSITRHRQVRSDKCHTIFLTCGQNGQQYLRMQFYAASELTQCKAREPPAAEDMILRMHQALQGSNGLVFLGFVCLMQDVLCCCCVCCLLCREIFKTSPPSWAKQILELFFSLPRLPAKSRNLQRSVIPPAARSSNIYTCPRGSATRYA